jgi:TatD DNase family protein
LASLIDICVNLTNKSFRGDETTVLARARQAGVRRIIVTGSSLEDSRDCLRIAECHPDSVWATAGVHPHRARSWTEASGDALRAVCAHPEVRAVGETGLDYNRNYSPPTDQRRAFRAQLEVATDLGLPVFLHERDAHDDFLFLLSHYRARLPGAVVHCFTGDERALRAYLDLDCHIGITGWICDERRGTHLRTLVRQIPQARLLVETDSPYLLPRDLPVSPPVAHRNEPAFLPHILATLAASRREDPEELAAATTRNAIAFYGLPSGG